jgi:hypothetical protein
MKVDVVIEIIFITRDGVDIENKEMKFQEI